MVYHLKGLFIICTNIFKNTLPIWTSSKYLGNLYQLEECRYDRLLDILDLLEIWIYLNNLHFLHFYPISCVSSFFDCILFLFHFSWIKLSEQSILIKFIIVDAKFIMYVRLKFQLNPSMVPNIWAFKWQLRGYATKNLSSVDAVFLSSDLVNSHPACLGFI